MEGHHRPAHPLTQRADAPPPLCGSAGDDDHIPAADRQPVAHLDLRALLQSDRRGGGFIDGAVGAHHHRSDHHIARHRAVDGDLVGGVVEQIRHLLAAGVRSAAHRHLSGERGAGIGDARVFHGFTQDGADGVGVEQGGDPFGVALAEAMSGHRGVILPRVVAVAGEHVGAVEWAFLL